MTKILDGRELAGYIKERQAQTVRTMRSRKIFPKLVIIRDSDNPVITKYVGLKKKYGEDIGVEVVDQKIAEVKNAENLAAAKDAIIAANNDASVAGIIVQLPLADKNMTDDVVNLIAPEKDVDGLNQLVGIEADGSSNSGNSSTKSAGDADNAKNTSGTRVRKFESATATAISWLLAGNGIELANKKVALVGYGRLVGQPLKRIFDKSKVETEVFRHDSDLSRLAEFDVIITATGVPHLIKSEMVKPGAVLVDAGTASEDGVLVGDVDEAVRTKADLAAITPKVGGVGPMTVTVLFDDVLQAAENNHI